MLRNWFNCVDTAAWKVWNIWFLLIDFKLVVSSVFCYVTVPAKTKDGWATIGTIATLILIKYFYRNAEVPVFECST